MSFIPLLRLHTLPLAISVILTANALAFYQGSFRFIVLLLSVLTAASLQLVSNVADDYGDGARGTDSHREDKLLNSGQITLAEIKRITIIASAISCGLGITLLAVSLHSWHQWLIFLGLGVFSLLGAWCYTVGQHAYGYHGLGDIAVFVFFGLIAVGGSYALQTNYLDSYVLLAAIGAGCLSAAVLNVNNMRDIETDARAGKVTVAVRLGLARSKYFHLALVVIGLFCYACYAFSAFSSLLWVIVIPKIVQHITHIFNASDEKSIGVELKSMMICQVLVNILFSLGIVIAKLV